MNLHVRILYKGRRDLARQLRREFDDLVAELTCLEAGTGRSFTFDAGRSLTSSRRSSKGRVWKHELANCRFFFFCS